jgi:hypothetical protein
MYFRVISKYFEVFLICDDQFLCCGNNFINQISKHDEYIDSLKSPVIKTQDLNHDQFDLMVDAVFVLGYQTKNMEDMVCVTKVNWKITGVWCGI